METNTRFKGAPWFIKEEGLSIFIGGAGGIGSWVTLFLSRAGYKVVVADYDTIEEHNLGGQFFLFGDIGKKKVAALHGSMQKFSDTSITGLDIKLNESFYESVLNNSPNLGSFRVVVSAFDNMEARTGLFNFWERTLSIEDNVNIPSLFIDGRLEMEQMQIFCVTSDIESREEYRRTLFSDGDVPDLSCTMKQTSHCAAMIASHMTGFITNHVANWKTGVEAREVPAYFEYVIPSNHIETE